MKILITGANGMLAKAVRERFAEEELILTDVEELDITNLEKVEEFVANCKPDVIINCAAYTAVDKAEEQLELARKINCDGPRNLAIVAKKQHSILVHISTDYVFGGELSVENIYEVLPNWKAKRLFKKKQVSTTFSEQRGYMETEITL